MGAVSHKWRQSGTTIAKDWDVGYLLQPFTEVPDPNLELLGRSHEIVALGNDLSSNRH